MKLYDDPVWLHEQYWVNGKNQHEMEQLAKCSHGAMQRSMRKHYIPTRNMSVIMKERYTDPELLARMSTIGKTLWSNQEYRDKIADIKSTQEYKDKMLIIMANQEYRDKVSAIITAKWTEPEYRDKITAANIATWSNLALRARASAILTDLIANGKFNPNANYKYGIYESLKGISKDNNNYILHRSSYEYVYYRILDNNPDVLYYIVEPRKIPYNLNGVPKYYTPDIQVYYTDDHIELVEIKPTRLLKLPRNIAKAEAAQKYCEEFLDGAVFTIITEAELFAD